MTPSKSIKCRRDFSARTSVSKGSALKWRYLHNARSLSAVCANKDAKMVLNARQFSIWSL